MPILRREQFDAIAHTIHQNAAGGQEAGATFDSHTGHTPKRGLAVSLAGSGEPLPSADLSGEHLEDYAQRYDPSLSRSAVHQGVWVPGQEDPEHGTAWLDNTQVFHDKAMGKTEMMAQNERSAYDLDSGEQINNAFRVPIKGLKNKVVGEALGRGIANNIRAAQGRPTLEADESLQRSRARP